jgi:hypothetical protein
MLKLNEAIRFQLVEYSKGVAWIPVTQHGEGLSAHELDHGSPEFIPLWLGQHSDVDHVGDELVHTVAEVVDEAGCTSRHFQGLSELVEYRRRVHSRVRSM